MYNKYQRHTYTHTRTDTQTAPACVLRSVAPGKSLHKDKKIPLKITQESPPTTKVIPKHQSGQTEERHTHTETERCSCTHNRDRIHVSWFKAALINIFTWAIGQMTTCNMKGVVCSDKTTENYHPTLRFSSALWHNLVSFSALFWFYGPQPWCFVSLLSATSFPPASGSCFS